MSGHRLDSQTDGTVEQNDIMPALLGLSKLLDDMSERLEASPAPREAAAPPCDRDIVLALLGVLALRRTLRNWLGQCGGGSPQSFPDPQIDAAAAWRLLR